MEKVDVVLIGYGHLGKWHAEKAYLSQKANLVAIVDPAAGSQSAAAEKFADVQICTSLSEVQSDFQAAIVATPTAYHFEVVKPLLKKGIHVFCEKPLTPTYAESLELREILNDETLLQIGHSERVHEVWEEIKSYPDFFNGPAPIVHFKRVAPYKGRATDVDVIQDLMIHDIDLAFLLFGQRPIVVRAYGEKIRTDKYDYVWSEVLFDRGLRCTFTASRNDVAEQRLVELINRHGTLMVDLFRNEFKLALASAEDENAYVTSHTYNKRDHLAYEQECFYSSILTGDEPYVGIEDALNVAKVMDAMKESIILGKEIQLR